MRDDIDSIIAALSFSKVKMDPRSGASDRVPVSLFKRAVPFGDTIVDAYPADYAVWMDTTPNDLSEPFDVAVASTGADYATFIRARACDSKRVRGKVTRVTQTMAEVLYLSVDLNTLHATPGREYWGFAGGEWHYLSHHTVKTHAIRGFDTVQSEYRRKQLVTDSTLFSLAGIQFNRPYMWHATFEDEGASLSFPTDPAGARALLADRDKVGSRRPALRNWVTQHWRQSRADPESELYVRKHMRGRTLIDWYGYKVAIEPSTDALAELRRHREAERPDPRPKGAHA